MRNLAEIKQGQQTSISYSSLPFQIALAVLCGGAISLPFLVHQYYPLAWIAFVPLLLAVEQASLARSYLIGLVTGLLAFASGMYWIVDFIRISKGYDLQISLGLAGLYWLYCAQFIALLVIAYKWLRVRTSLHEFFLFPVLLTSFTAAYPMLFAMRLSESQVFFRPALQAIEWFGAYGLDFVIALANVLVFRVFYTKFSGMGAAASAKWPGILATLFIAVWLGYGFLSMPVWDQKISQWSTQKFGIVQPNEVPRLGKKTLYPGYSYAYPPEMEMTERLSTLGADIVVWPEGQSKAYLDDVRIRKAYQRAVTELGITLVFQDMQHQRSPINGEVTMQRSLAVMLDSHRGPQQLYQKIKRIPFGEYVPLLPEGSWAKQSLQVLFGEFLTELSAGDRVGLFANQTTNLVPLICYETTFPEFVADAVKETLIKSDNELGTILLGLSNDGWFGSTHQPYQHIMPSVLRAVENRVPVLHVANNGPSIAITPAGEIIFTSDFQRAGGYTVDLPYSDKARGSFYSRFPSLFKYLVYMATVWAVLLALHRTRLGRVRNG